MRRQPRIRETSDMTVVRLWTGGRRLHFGDDFDSSGDSTSGVNCDGDLDTPGGDESATLISFASSIFEVLAPIAAAYHLRQVMLCVFSA
jgi:hypothetical protein